MTPQRSGGYAERLGIEFDMVVQEIGWDDDVDESLRADILETLDDELVGEDFREVVDVLLLWWRSGDGDLVDALMDGLALLATDGFIWLLTPKKGEIGYVDATDIAEAATTSGLSQTLTENFDTWLAHQLLPRKNKVNKK